MTETDMPEEIIFIDPPKIGNKTYSKYALDHDVIPYRLKSTVDAELAKYAEFEKRDDEKIGRQAATIDAQNKTIAALAFALEIIVEQSPDNLAVGTAKQALSDNATCIAKAQDNQK